MITLEISQGWSLHHLNMDDAFLNGDLKESVFMAQASSFINKQHLHKVCHLNISFYGS